MFKSYGDESIIICFAKKGVDEPGARDDVLMQHRNPGLRNSAEWEKAGGRTLVLASFSASMVPTYGDNSGTDDSYGVATIGVHSVHAGDYHIYPFLPRSETRDLLQVVVVEQHETVLSISAGVVASMDMWLRCHI